MQAIITEEEHSVVEITFVTHSFMKKHLIKEELLTTNN